MFERVPRQNNHLWPTVGVWSKTCSLVGSTSWSTCMMKVHSCWGSHQPVLHGATVEPKGQEEKSGLVYSVLIKKGNKVVLVWKLELRIKSAAEDEVSAGGCGRQKRTAKIKAKITRVWQSLTTLIVKQHFSDEQHFDNIQLRIRVKIIRLSEFQFIQKISLFCFFAEVKARSEQHRGNPRCWFTGWETWRKIKTSIILN